MSKKMNAETTEVSSSHVAMVAKPKEVTEVILRALGKSAEL
jgi:hypothetical protein